MLISCRVVVYCVALYCIAAKVRVVGTRKEKECANERCSYGAAVVVVVAAE